MTLGTGLFVSLVKNPADGTEPGWVTDQLGLEQSAGNIDRADVDVGPAALLQDALDPALVGEGKLPRRVRLAGGDVRQEWCRGAQYPGVQSRRDPAREFNKRGSFRHSAAGASKMASHCG